MEYKVISADSHIDISWMPGNLWIENSPASLRDQVPRVVETKDGPRWIAEGKELGAFGSRGTGFQKVQKGAIGRIDKMFNAGFYDGQAHPTTPELRLKDMQMDGIDAEVIYGLTGAGTLFENPELTRVLYEVYNAWVADFCNTYPGRWVALACLPGYDPKVSAEVLRNAAQLGLRGADFMVAKAVKPLWHRDWDVLWQVAAECNMPISFHIAGCQVRAPDDPQMGQEYLMQYQATQVSLNQVFGSEFLASIIFSGACDRYPDFKFVLGECGVTWIPHVLNRMDEEWDDRFNKLGYSLKPSEFWRRQGYTTFQHEMGVPRILDIVGEENVLWGNDYPHNDGVWPDSKETLDEDLAGVSEETFRKLTRDNTGKLYGFLD